MKKYNAEFIKQLNGDDRVAQKLLFSQLFAPIFRVCQRYIDHRQEAEDCAMKGFMKVFQQIGKFEYRDEESLFWWVRRVMINEALMALRKNHNFYLLPEEHFPETQVPAEVWNKLDAEDLNTLIMRLPTGYRTVFCLHVVEGYGHNEIAGMLGITESTSKTQLIKAKGRLKKMIEQLKDAYGNVGR
jgi:RNA polymerase sigma factor (sigma-70 family)